MDSKSVDKIDPLVHPAFLAYLDSMDEMPDKADYEAQLAKIDDNDEVMGFFKSANLPSGNIAKDDDMAQDAMSPEIKVESEDEDLANIKRFSDSYQVTFAGVLEACDNLENTHPNQFVNDPFFPAGKPWSAILFRKRVAKAFAKVMYRGGAEPEELLDELLKDRREGRWGPTVSLRHAKLGMQDEERVLKLRRWGLSYGEIGAFVGKGKTAIKAYLDALRVEGMNGEELREEQDYLFSAEARSAYM